MPAQTDQLPALDREAQQSWAQTPLTARLRIIRRVRHQIAARATELTDTVTAPAAETLVAQVLPLADACRFLERRAPRILASRQLGDDGRPFWMRGTQIELRREPFGIVLIIGAANYPLFLPGVQVLQALVAGNAVLLKPGTGGTPPARALASLLTAAGLDARLLRVLDESPDTARAAMAAGVDKVVLTGSAETGAAVLAELAPRLIPATMELSGRDPVFVRADADLELVVAALKFGVRLNDGVTCIAPRRVFVARELAAQLQARLAGLLEITPVANDAEALTLAARSPYALGATVFGRETGARALAERVRAGVVVINDMIVPTADPRVPFGGRGRSGFGLTRGAEGLREMTCLKTVITRRGRWRPHFLEPQKQDAQLFAAYIQAAHGERLPARLTAGFTLLRALAKRKL